MDVNAGEPGHEPVGAAGGNAAHDEVVDALFAPAGDDVVAFFKPLEEAGDLVGIVLQVAVHGEDEFAGGVVEAGGERRGLAEVAAELYDEDAAVDRGNLFKQTIAAVSGAIVDEDQLKALPDLFHDLLQAGIEDGDILFFVVKRHDNGIFRHIDP